MTPSALTPREHIRQIIADGARDHGVDISDIFSSSRRRPHWLARREAIRAVKRAYPRITTQALGKMFGRSHTTILYALGQRGARKRATA